MLYKGDRDSLISSHLEFFFRDRARSAACGVLRHHAQLTSPANRFVRGDSISFLSVSAHLGRAAACAIAWSIRPAAITPFAARVRSVCVAADKREHPDGKHSSQFRWRSDGVDPDAGLTNVRGTLYGTTYDGGASSNGTVFTITTSGAESVIHSFAGGSDGSGPAADLINVGGVLYGTTSGGGASASGTVLGSRPPARKEWSTVSRAAATALTRALP